MNNPASALPDYDNPPVIEVVFGIQFKELSEFQAPHTGLLWEKLGRKEFPEFQVMPPLPTTFETFDQRSAQPAGVNIEAMTHPPLSRLLFVNKQKNHLIQIQQDRFLQNWRKLQPSDKYPRFADLFPKFKTSWELFAAFANEIKLGPTEVNQYELTYINHIPRGEGWVNLFDIGNIFPHFLCKREARFLPEPETLGWRKVYRFPDNKGRLHVTLRQAINRQTQDLILVLDLTARGFSSEPIDKWFDMAHEWIVRGFADLTSLQIQESVWKRKK